LPYFLKKNYCKTSTCRLIPVGGEPEIYSVEPGITEIVISALVGALFGTAAAFRGETRR